MTPPQESEKRIVRYHNGRKSEAEDIRAKLETEISQGTYTEPSKLTFGEFLLNWLEDYGRTRHCPNHFGAL